MISIKLCDGEALIGPRAACERDRWLVNNKNILFV